MIALLSRLVGPPMAAPETARLRAMRISMILLALVLAGTVMTLERATRLLGPAAAGIAGGVLLVLCCLVPLYLRAKRRADEAHFDRLVARAQR